MTHDIEELLRGAFGLNAESVSRTAIARAVHERMAALGVLHMREYEQCLLRDTDELQELIEQVVVPETWFFRNPESLAALTELVTTEWLPNHRGQILRVLSVPCSTGEEPYSIAMTLAEAGLERAQVRLDAIDLSRRALARAERGVYGPNSFRDEGNRIHHRYSTVVANAVEVGPAIRQWVRFAQGNLTSAGFRPPEQSYDVVFCRNVLIYFDQSVQERVLDTLHRLITPQGYLFVGPAEAIGAAERGFASAGYRMAFAFRKAPPRVPKLESVPGPTRAPALAASIAAPPLRRSNGLPRRTPARARPIVRRTPRDTPATDPPETDLAAARGLADRGKLVEAAQMCEAFVHQHGTSVAAWYLLGLVRDAMGESARATECYRKALFLDPTHAEASMHLGILRRVGLAAAGARGEP